KKLFFFSSRRRHTIFSRDWSSDVCSSDLNEVGAQGTNWLDYRLGIDVCRRQHRNAVPFGQRRQVDKIRVHVGEFERKGNEQLGRSEERRVGKECRLCVPPAHVEITRNWTK